MKRTVFCLVGAMLITAVGTPAADADGHESMVYVVHGIPGQDLGLEPALPVDVSVNGACALESFAFARCDPGGGVR